MAAIMNLDPSLIQYLGGGGRAFGAIGNSINQIGQAKLDLEQKDVDNKKAQAYLDLQRQNTQLGLDNASYVKKKDFETRNDKFTSNANTNALILGEDAPVEMSNRYAQLSNMDPAVTAKMIPEPTKIIGDYKGVDGKMWNRYSDGSAKPVNAGAGFYDPSMFDKSLQYIKGADGKTKVPTLVLTNMFSGQNRETPLDGETASEYNERLSKALSLENTLTAQKKKAALDVVTQPQIEDIKETKKVQKTVEDLVSEGYKKVYYSDLVKLQEKNPNINWQKVPIRGVDHYYVK